MSANVVWHHATVTRQMRQQQNQHPSVIIWFTGLSGSGKSTLAHALEEALYQRGCRTFVMDGDNVRHGLCQDLGFSEADRRENIRRVGEVAKLMLEAGVIVLTAFISPFREDRARVRGLVPHGEFLEVYCEASVAVCEARDVKGLYKRARNGEVANFTGISAPYETPDNPDLVINTASCSVAEGVASLLQLLTERAVISSVTTS
ncbi:MAG: adenylyl-sulfate kinase [Gammaproteobacteria bacterium]|nr:adenylyl-sulfate kinase [Gammaproteobacteria bacterium]